MAKVQDAPPTYSGREARADQDKPTSSAEPAAVTNKADTLTLITSDGEVIVFDGMDVPIAEATALASEDALAKIWNRPVEDAAWHDI